MARISRQRLFTGLSAFFDFIVIGLFFLQGFIAEHDFLRFEITNYHIWSSVFDLMILSVVKGIVILILYAAIGTISIMPCLLLGATASVVAFAKIVLFITHSALTKQKLTGVHYVIPIFMLATGWIQFAISKVMRDLDARFLCQYTDHGSLQYTPVSINGDATRRYGSTTSLSIPAKAAPMMRRNAETTPLLNHPDSLSSSVNITVNPSVPDLPSLLPRKEKDFIRTDQIQSKKLLPELVEIVKLMVETISLKTYIRSFNPVQNAFTGQEAVSWIIQNFSGCVADTREAVHILQRMMDANYIVSAPNPNVTKVSNTASDLYQFTNLGMKLSTKQKNNFEVT